MKVEVSIGEIFDKVSILQIKKERILDKVKLGFVNSELDYLQKCLFEENIECPQDLFLELKEINEELWDIEDLLREKYNKNQLDNEYMEKMVYDIILNDKRFLVKKKINDLLDSSIKEQKSYKGM